MDDNSHTSGDSSMSPQTLKNIKLSADMKRPKLGLKDHKAKVNFKFELEKRDKNENREVQDEKGHQNQLSGAKLTKLSSLVQIGEDWLYLALLGIIMALLSFSMDSVISLLLNTRSWLSLYLSNHNLLLQYIGWCIIPILLVSFSSSFVHLCSPTAIGSGIPEMKTILRGVILNEYLTFRTLVAKIVGLTFTLGSGLPLGKEGPFVHMASIVATLLSKLVASFQGIYENESRTSEMLSAACAVGVAATFYAPIGGVLFSIEVTTVYFAVRNYWRGFFAACCGATIWRLLGFWIKNDESISALFKTNFRTDYPFDPVELLVFSFIGASCGLAGAAYIWFHREIVQFFRRHKNISLFLQKNRYIYPILVTLIITSVTFPQFIGKYTASTLNTHATIEHLFSNITWGLGHQDLVSKKILDVWTTPDTSFHLHLVLYIVMLFWTSALASTIPIPSGLFIPVLKMGAAYGRLVGELMHSAFPDGIQYGGYVRAASIVPGSYAVVGAASLSGAVTHTISTSVILFEMTGQIVHIIPVILGVLIANAVCQSLQPSIYDSIIEIKKLPYLPSIASSNSVAHRILVKDFMNTNLAFVWKEKCTYNDLKNLLSQNKKLISFPLVDSPETMKLLGSVARLDLLKLLYMHLGRERRLQEVYRRNSETIAPPIFLLNVPARLRDKDDLSANDPVIEEPNGADLSTSDVEQRFRRNSSGSQELGLEKSKSESDINKLKKNYRLENCDEPINNTESDNTEYPAHITPNVSHKLEQEIGYESSSSSDFGDDSGIARIINRYNRGSIMNDDSLREFQQTVKQKAEELPKIFVVDASQDENSSGSSEKSLAFEPNHGARFQLGVKNDTYSQCYSNNLKINMNEEPKIMKSSENQNKISSKAKLRQSTSFANSSPATSPSLSQRPTKSILKSSSTTTNLGNLNKRNTSNQSFSNNLSVDFHQNKASTGFGVSQLSGYSPRIPHPSARIDSNQLEVPKTSEPSTFRHRRKVRLPRLRVVDMTVEEQEQWERDQLNAFIDISKCQVDEAPLQLVEQTSLYRVHTLFSMLGLNHAYVTSFGRLVGIVALKDIRSALEKMFQD